MNNKTETITVSEATYQQHYRLPYTKKVLKRNTTISFNDFSKEIKKEFEERIREDDRFNDFSKEIKKEIKERIRKEDDYPFFGNRILNGFYNKDKIGDINYTIQESIHNARLQYWQYVSDDAIFLKLAEDMLKKYKITENDLYILSAIYMKEIIAERLYTHYIYKWLLLPEIISRRLEFERLTKIKNNISFKNIEEDLRNMKKIFYIGENYRSPLLHREKNSFYNLFAVGEELTKSGNTKIYSVGELPTPKEINPYNLDKIDTLYRKVYPTSLYIRELFLEDYIKRKTNNYNESIMFSIKETDDILMSTDEGAQFLYSYFRAIFYTPLIISTPMLLGEESLDRLSWEEASYLGEDTTRQLLV